MRIPGRKRLTQRSAARALDRAGSSGTPEIDNILAAASAPATNFELNREADAVAMFRSTVPRTANAKISRPTLVQAARTRFAAAKLGVATGVAVALVGGGVAFAATGHHISDVIPGHLGSSHSVSPTPHKGNGPKSGATPSSKPVATPSPALRGLCKSYWAQLDHTHGKAMSSAAKRALAKQAGGADEILGYCTTLLFGNVEDPGAPASTHPAHPSHPSHPTHPAKSPKPTDPAEPTSTETAKAHPTHPAHPTKSPKPGKSSHSG